MKIPVFSSIKRTINEKRSKYFRDANETNPIGIVYRPKSADDKPIVKGDLQEKLEFYRDYYRKIYYKLSLREYF
jgi:hypothetical protein